jgi:hypothetical protein
MPPEPWIYPVLDAVGRAAFVLGWFLACVGLMRWYRGTEAASGIGSAPVLVFAGLLLVLLAAVPMLGVEIARQVRAIRYPQS